MANKILIISGATASGKSQLALRIAEKYDGQIINCDAMQIYAGLPILSAQPSADDFKNIPHHLYSQLPVNQNSSVDLWLNLAVVKITEILQQNKLPIIVGGSGMYISRLVKGIADVPKINLQNQQKARDFCQNNSIEQVVDFLQQKIPGSYQNLDKQRLARNLEVYFQTNKSLQYFYEQEPKTFFNQDDFIHLNLLINRDLLYKNCNLRFAQMLKSGAIDEVKELTKNHTLSATNLITKTIGFAQILDYLDSKINHQFLIEASSKQTRNFAKRQLTWFRHQFSDTNMAVIDESFDLKSLNFY